MAAITTPYASGTITSVSGTSVTVSGGAIAAWVGRCIRITTGSAAGQIRKILTAPTATTITIDYAFTTSPFAGFTEVDPVSGDGFVISWAIPDIADGTSIIVDPGALSYRFVGASSFAGGAFVYAANARIDLVSSSLTTTSATQDLRCCLRFGDVDALGNVFNGCHILDTAAAPSGFNPTGGVSMDLHFYGGVVRCTGASPFWRSHTDNNGIVRMIGVDVDGNIGGRFQGSRSILDNWSVYNNTSASGPFNPKASFGKISNIRVAKSLQALYHYWPDSLTLEAEGIKPDSSVTKLVRFANAATSGQRLTVKDVNIPVIQSLPLLYTNSSGTYSNSFRLSQYFNAAYVSAAGAAITDSTRFVVRDVTTATVYDDAVTTGSIPQQTLRYRDMTVLTAGDYTWASAGGVTYAPYAVAAISYLYQPATLPLPLLTSQSVNLVALSDANVSQTNKATVDAYTDIDTLDKLYDRAKSWTVDNLSAANPSFGVQVATGNGSELDLGAFDLVVDATAASAFSIASNTLTIKASVLSAGAKFLTFKTTGTLTLLNGASVGVSYTTGAGSFASISIFGLLAGSRIQLYNVTDSVEMVNQIVAGTNYSAIFPFPGTRTIRLRADKMGYIGVQQSNTFIASGLSFSVSQTVDDVYAANAVDGSTVTELTADFPNVQIDINDPDGLLSIKRVYAWYQYITSTEDGIRNFFGGLIAEDQINYKIVTSIVNLKFDNVSAIPVKIIDGRIYRDDNTTVIASGSIELDPGKAYTANLGIVTQLVQELHALQGLTTGVPMTVTPTSRVAGSITLTISGDGTTTTTVERV